MKARTARATDAVGVAGSGGVTTLDIVRGAAARQKAVIALDIVGGATAVGGGPRDDALLCKKDMSIGDDIGIGALRCN